MALECSLWYGPRLLVQGAINTCVSRKAATNNTMIVFVECVVEESRTLQNSSSLTNSLFSNVMFSCSCIVFNQVCNKNISLKKFYGLHESCTYFPKCSTTIFVEHSSTRFLIACYLEATYRKVVLLLQTTHFQMLCLPVVL
jgi:hypothetical protein